MEDAVRAGVAGEGRGRRDGVDLGGLAVMPGQVVQPGDGRVAADRAVGAVVIVEVQPAG